MSWKKFSRLFFLFIIIFLLTGSLTQPARAAELINPGFEEADGDSKALNWFDFGQGYKRVKNAQQGEWGIRLATAQANQFAGAWQRIDLNQNVQKPVFIGGWVRGNKINNSSGGYFGASLYAEIHLQDGSVAYWNSIGNFGSFGWRWIGFNTGTVATVNQPISHIFVVPVLGQATGVAIFDEIRVTEFDPNQAAVTIMIDDGEETALSVAKPVLDNFGFKASVAIIWEMIGEPGFMNLNEIKSLQSSDWEIVSHSLTHSDLTLISAKQARQEMANSQRKLQRQGLTVRNFALPYGAYNGEILATGAKFYSSLRAYEQGSNPQGAFPYDIKVRGILETTSIQELQSWMNEARDNHRWLVVVFHTLASEGDDAYHLDPAIFSQMIETVSQSGLPVITYQQGLERFAVNR
ncbi:MAG: polysaccharide deacetylase family protein [Candidatus Pacebacteria bacterium]|nr:polysaccharide deacetylase family protein [Candidatus Paceibacterota bacterium]